MADGADAVSMTNRRLAVGDGTVPSGRRTVDGGLLACDVTLLLIRLFVGGSLWSLQPGWEGSEVTVSPSTRHNRRHAGDKTPDTCCHLEDLLLVLSPLLRRLKDNSTFRKDKSRPFIILEILLPKVPLKFLYEVNLSKDIQAVCR